jgi:ABC-type antimicrobial peptide transport system permease subunit
VTWVEASIAIGFIGLLAGAATTTALTVAERSRSIGLLRMLGLTPAQLQGLLAARACSPRPGPS